MAGKLIIDCATGEARTVPLSDVEMAEQEANANAPIPVAVDRIAELEAEVRGMRDRVAAVEATGDAAKLRDAVRSPS